MTTRKELDAAPAPSDDAVAIYEAAKAEFDRLQQVIHERVLRGEPAPLWEFNREELARVTLFRARERLVQRATLHLVTEPKVTEPEKG
jgi:hypothetical protein